MKQAAAGDSTTRLTLAERYALYVATHASNAWWSLVLLAIAAAFVLLAIFRGVALWPLAVAFMFLALLYWERSGFRRLLARQESQPDRLSSHEDSA